MPKCTTRFGWKPQLTTVLTMFHPIIPPQRGYNTWQDMHSGHWMKLEFMSNSNPWPPSIALVLKEVTGLNPIEAMIFLGFFFPIT